MKGKDDKLCYLDASKLDSPVGALTHLDLKGADDRLLGVLDGIVIDPTERKLRYFVVKSKRLAEPTTLSGARRRRCPRRA